jgi:hypothetical protein
VNRPNLGVGGGWRSFSPTNSKFEIYEFCKHGDMKRFTRYTLSPKSALKSTDEEYIRIFENKIKQSWSVLVEIWNKTLVLLI